MDLNAMNKMQLREACKAAGIKGASRMTNDGMRAALLEHVQDNLKLSPNYNGVDINTYTPVIDTTPHPSHNVPVGTEVSGELYARAGTPDVLVVADNDDPLPVSPSFMTPDPVRASWQRLYADQAVINNTRPRNRKGRAVPSRFRTAGRVRRFIARNPDRAKSINECKAFWDSVQR